MLLVLFILSLSIMLVSPSTKGLNDIKLKTTAKRVAADLIYARNHALRERQGYYVEALGERIMITARNGRKKETLLPDKLRVEPLGNVIIFYPAGGSNGGRFDIKDREKTYYSVKVESTGRVKVVSE